MEKNHLTLRSLVVTFLVLFAGISTAFAQYDYAGKGTFNKQGTIDGDGYYVIVLNNGAITNTVAPGTYSYISTDKSITDDIEILNNPEVNMVVKIVNYSSSEKTFNIQGSSDNYLFPSPDELYYDKATLCEIVNNKLVLKVKGMFNRYSTNYIIAKTENTLGSSDNENHNSITTIKSIYKIGTKVAEKIPLATPVVEAANAIGDNGFTIKWSAVENTSSYNVYVYEGTEQITGSPFAVTGATEYAITGLASGTEYGYEVEAIAELESTYKDSEKSAKLLVTTTGEKIKEALKTPSPHIDPTCTTTDGFEVYWMNNKEAIDYVVKIYKNNKLVDKSTYTIELRYGGQPRAIISNIEANTTYQVSVISIADAGSNFKDSEESAKVEVTTLNDAPKVKLAKPTAYAATEITKEGFTANWSKVENATKYKISIHNVELGSSKNRFPLDGDIVEKEGKLTYKIKGLLEGTNYSYTVQAQGEENGNYENSEFSNAITFTTLSTQTPLAKPIIYNAENVKSSSFTIKWDKVENAFKYAITVIDVEYPDAQREITILDEKAQIDENGKCYYNVEYNEAIMGIYPETKYSYQIKAIGTMGGQFIPSESDIMYVTTTAAIKLTTPEVYNATNITHDAFTINWSKVENALGYFIYVYKGSATESEPITLLLESLTEVDGKYTYVYSGAKANTQYKYAIAAGGDGINFVNSELSNNITLTTTDPGSGTNVEDNVSENIIVYSNNDNIYVNRIEKGATVYVYDMTGKIVYSAIASNNTLEIMGLNKGIYNIQVVADGNIKSAKTII